jgi:hypothetical protein
MKSMACLTLVYQLNLARREEYLFQKMKNVVLVLTLNSFRVKHGIIMYVSDVESEHKLIVYRPSKPDETANMLARTEIYNFAISFFS